MMPCPTACSSARVTSILTRSVGAWAKAAGKSKRESGYYCGLQHDNRKVVVSPLHQSEDFLAIRTPL